MAEDRDAVLLITDIEKDFRSLRPLRLRHLQLHAAETIALLGFDQAAAEVLVNLIASATLPDKGEVVVLGRTTASITDGESWIKALDELGIVSERAVLLEQMTVEQNLAVPLTLELHDMPHALRQRIAALGAEVHLEGGDLARFAATLTPLQRWRLRLGRALALDPRILLAEHPNASVPADAAATVAADLVEVRARRRLSMLVLTADPVFADAVADRVLQLNAATGELTAAKTGWRRWFS